MEHHLAAPMFMFWLWWPWKMMHESTWEKLCSHWVWDQGCRQEISSWLDLDPHLADQHTHRSHDQWKKITSLIKQSKTNDFLKGRGPIPPPHPILAIWSNSDGPSLSKETQFGFPIFRFWIHIRSYNMFSLHNFQGTSLTKVKQKLWGIWYPYMMFCYMMPVDCMLVEKQQMSVLWGPRDLDSRTTTLESKFDHLRVSQIMVSLFY